jgi:hypothetical protein
LNNEEKQKSHFLLLMRTIPGAYPAGALRASKFAPGEFVVLGKPMDGLSQI